MTPITLSGNFVSLGISQSAMGAMVGFIFLIAEGWNQPLAIVAVVAGLVLIGVLQGAIVSAGLNPILTTLAAGAIIFGVVAELTDGKVIRMGANRVGWGNNEIVGIPLEVIVFLVVTAAVTVLMAKTVIGRQTVLTGANANTAEISGISFRRITIVAFVIFSIGLAIAGILNAAGFGQGEINSLSTLTIDSIAALLVGGVAITGGEGSPLRSAAGAMLIAVDQQHDGAQRLQHRRPARGAGRSGRGRGHPPRVASTAAVAAVKDAGSHPLLLRLRAYALPIVILIGVWIFISATTDTFRGEAAIFSVLEGFPLMGLVALGLAVTIIAGELDLSVGSMAAVAGAVAVRAADAGLIGAVLIAVAVGAVIGALQGGLIAKLGINSLVFTIGTLILLRGVSLAALRQRAAAARGRDGLRPAARPLRDLLGGSIAALLVFVLFGLFLAYTRYGREIYAIGGGRAEARVGRGVRERGRSFLPSRFPAVWPAWPALWPRCAEAAPRPRTTPTCCSPARPPRFSAESASTAGAGRCSTSPSGWRFSPQ